MPPLKSPPPHIGSPQRGGRRLAQCLGIRLFAFGGAYRGGGKFAAGNFRHGIFRSGLPVTVTATITVTVTVSTTITTLNASDCFLICTCGSRNSKRRFSRGNRNSITPSQILTATFLCFSSCGRAQQTYAT